MHYLDDKLQFIVISIGAQSQQVNITPDSIFFVRVLFEIGWVMEYNFPASPSFQRDYSIKLFSDSI